MSEKWKLWVFGLLGCIPIILLMLFASLYLGSDLAFNSDTGGSYDYPIFEFFDYLVISVFGYLFGLIGYKITKKWWGAILAGCIIFPFLGCIFSLFSF